MLKADVWALSPIDGRYLGKTSSLRTHFSEAALISSRIKIELLYLLSLSEIGVVRQLSAKEKKKLCFLQNVDETAILRVKEIEQSTHHDVKAVEYYLREQLNEHGLADLTSFLHFAITSEDVNNIAYRLMMSRAVEKVVWPALGRLLLDLRQLISEQAALPILARTHGQAAIPSTFGKEWAVFASRLLPIFEELQVFKFRAKLSGAVGGYQAMSFAYPTIDWPEFSTKFVKSLGFDLASLSTQICPPDDLIKLFGIFYRLNGVLLDLNQDVWRYISDGWLLQKGKEKFVGSSTMPQKINPIEFENSEGNLVMANAMLEGMMRKLPVSRLQRDLSDSTVMRNVGSVFAYCLLAYQSLDEGLSKLAVDEEAAKRALHHNYNILSEAWQTLARKNGDQSAYEKAALLSKNKVISAADWLVLSQGMPEELRQLNPDTYLGLSVDLAKQTVVEISDFLDNTSQLSTNRKG